VSKLFLVTPEVTLTVTSNMIINHQMEHGDMLVVLKIDRLGRDNIDVQNTINLLTNKGIKVAYLDLPVAVFQTNDKAV
tara:strand:+ start:20002 stop:20235 length:234 start_codon:yes stop_codon:yes gene_type:complete